MCPTLHKVLHGLLLIHSSYLVSRVEIKDLNMDEKDKLQPAEELNNEVEREETPEGDDSPEGDEEVITIPKSQLDKLTSERDNYRTVALAAKKGKTKEPAVVDAPKSDMLTVDDQYKRMEKDAIASVTTPGQNDSEPIALRKVTIDQHWDDIKEYIPVSKLDKRTATQSEIEKIILAGYGAWKEATGFEPSAQDAKDALANIPSAPGGQGTRQNPAAAPKKSVLGKNTPVTEWYQ